MTETPTNPTHNVWSPLRTEAERSRPYQVAQGTREQSDAAGNSLYTALERLPVAFAANTRVAGGGRPVRVDAFDGAWLVRPIRWRVAGTTYEAVVAYRPTPDLPGAKWEYRMASEDEVLTLPSRHERKALVACMVEDGATEIIALEASRLPAYALVHYVTMVDSLGVAPFPQ